LAGPGGPTVGRVNIRVAPDTSRFRRELGQSLEALERSLTVNIPTRIDTKKVAKDAARVKADVERQLGEVRTSVKVSADTAKASTEISAAARDRTATIRVNADQSALARIQGLAAGLGRSLGRLTGGAAGIGAIAGALSTVAAGAAAAVVPLLQLGTALAPAVGILATLPAIAGTAVAALAPLVVAFSGMGEALGAALSGDAQALTEALEGLAPAAQGVVLAVGELAPGLGRIRDMVQEGFFRPLVEPVQTLGSTLLPTLGRGLTQVSLALGESAATLLAFVQEGRNLAGLDLLFASTGRSVENLNGFMPGLLVGFRELGIVGLPFMEQLSLAASEAATEFGRWATHAAESGEATRWIEDAIVVFQELGGIASNVGGIIGTIFTAAGGAGLLSTIEDITGRFNEFLQSAEGSAALEGIFTGLGSIMTALQPVFGALISGIGTLAPAVGRIAEAFGPVLTAAIEGLVPALLELEPGIIAIVDALGEAVGALVDSGALETIGTALSDILIAVAPLLPVLGELAGVLLGALAEAAIALAPGLALIATAMAEGLAPVLPELSAAFAELMEALGPLIPVLIEALLPVLDILPALVSLLAENFSTWAGAIADLAPHLANAIQFGGFLIEVLMGLVVGLLGVLGAILRWAGESSQKVRDTLRGMIDRFQEFRDRAIGAIVGLLTRGRDTFNRMRSAFSTIVSAIRSAVVSGISSMVTSARERVSGLVSTVRGLPSRIRSALGNLGNLLRTAGRNVITGLINGITSRMSDLWRRMGEIAQGIRDYFPFSPARRGPLRINPPDVAGENITRMLADGLGRGASLVSAAADQVAGAAVMRPQPAAAAGIGMYAGIGEQTALLARLLEAIREGRGDVVLEVDSTEIARATQQGNRQLARR